MFGQFRLDSSHRWGIWIERRFFRGICPISLPANGVRNQAFRVPGKPIWATQFHPELDRQGKLERCEAYIKEYGRNDNHGREGGLPSPEAMTILPKFLELVAD